MRAEIANILRGNGYFHKVILRHDYIKLSDEEKANYIPVDLEHQRYGLLKDTFSSEDSILELLGATYENTKQLIINNQTMTTIKNILMTFLVITIISLILSILSFFII